MHTAGGKDYGDNYGAGLSAHSRILTLEDAVFTMKYNF